MARTVRDLAKLLDGMVGYDPEDPVTALGVGKVARTIRDTSIKGD
jgi:Asp-tRNA(Asn)/Glu-tRNA(Gln) amidotransferase A subunit family amidase